MENNQNNFNGNVEHVQLGGQAFYDESKFFMFSPDSPEVGAVKKFRSNGVGQQMADGTFDFVAKPALRPKSTLIKKLAHGRISATADGAIQLTLKVFKNEGLDCMETIMKEAREATV